MRPADLFRRLQVSGGGGVAQGRREAAAGGAEEGGRGSERPQGGRKGAGLERRGRPQVPGESPALPPLPSPFPLPPSAWHLLPFPLCLSRASCAPSLLCPRPARGAFSSPARGPPSPSFAPPLPCLKPRPAASREDVASPVAFSLRQPEAGAGERVARPTGRNEAPPGGAPRVPKVDDGEPFSAPPFPLFCSFLPSPSAPLLRLLSFFPRRSKLLPPPRLHSPPPPLSPSLLPPASLSLPLLVHLSLPPLSCCASFPSSPSAPPCPPPPALALRLLRFALPRWQQKRGLLPPLGLFSRP